MPNRRYCMDEKEDVKRGIIMFYRSIKTICEFLAVLFIFAVAMILPELF